MCRGDSPPNCLDGDRPRDDTSTVLRVVMDEWDVVSLTFLLLCARQQKCEGTRSPGTLVPENEPKPLQLICPRHN